jgi:hypothetical protein
VVAAEPVDAGEGNVVMVNSKASAKLGVASGSVRQGGGNSGTEFRFG